MDDEPVGEPSDTETPLTPGSLLLPKSPPKRWNCGRIPRTGGISTLNHVLIELMQHVRNIRRSFPYAFGEGRKKQTIEADMNFYFVLDSEVRELNAADWKRRTNGYHNTGDDEEKGDETKYGKVYRQLVIFEDTGNVEFARLEADVF
ncbi:hypothetical protein ABW19_dt0205343 [Dactylella cylindrospora]|nr:hypothetical protein ABW19_dt0205343 [Dactylella cylindrospora]